MPSGPEVAARVGDRTITVKELDDRWRADAPVGAGAGHPADCTTGASSALDAIVADMLIEQAAKAKGQTPAQYRDAEVARRVTPVTDGQIAAFFAQNQAQMQGRPLEADDWRSASYLDQQERPPRFRRSSPSCARQVLRSAS